MGSPVSPIVANFTWNTLKGQPSVLPLPPQMWLRYVDGTFVIQQEEHKQNFLKHINDVDQAITFTVENSQQDGATPFLDTIANHEADNTLSLTVYRKPMHTDQYLQWDSHHNLAAKYNVISTPLPTELGLFAPNLNSLIRKYSTSGRPSLNANTLSRP